MPTIDIAIPKPHSMIQRQLITHPGNVAAFCGRRWGKTEGAVQRIFRMMTSQPGLYWWVGLSWRSASLKRAWRLVTDIARQVLRGMGLKERDYINKSSHEVRLPGLGEIWFRTADNPSSLAGEGIRGAVVDEFTLMQEVVWTEYLEATLLDYAGWVCFIGVPKGRNWAANLWRNASSRAGWLQLTASTYDNPVMDSDAIDEIRANTSEALFNQEYLALIVDDAGSVFRGVTRAVDADIWQDEPIEQHQYIMGVDWGKLNDYTVITVIDVSSGTVCYIDRFNKIDYVVQAQRLKVLADKFRPSQIIAESNSMGTAVIEQLQRMGLPITPFNTTNATKAAIIDGLANAFERDAIRIPDDPILISELQAYESQRTKSGLFTYNAPSGLHDDMVMSLAIGWSGMGTGFKVW